MATCLSGKPPKSLQIIFNYITFNIVELTPGAVENDRVTTVHMLNMELDLQSLFGLHVHSCTHWLYPRTLPRFRAHLRGRHGQPR